jgi:hypothetical protein
MALAAEERACERFGQPVAAPLRRNGSRPVLYGGPST